MTESGRKPVQSWVYGQGEDCDVRITDAYASTRHCKIVLYDDGSATVEDLGSTNGTWIRREGTSSIASRNVRVYGPIGVAPGMVVRIGNTDLPWRTKPVDSPLDDLDQALSKGGEAVANWYLQRSRRELLGYAEQMEAAAKRPELSLHAPGLLLAGKMLRDAAADEPDRD